MTFLSGQTLTAAALNAEIFDWRPVYVRKSADQTQSNTTTLLNDTHLFVSVAANLTYALEFVLIYEAGTVADYKWSFTFPAGATLSVGNHEGDLSMAYLPLGFSSYTSGGSTGLGGAGIGSPRAMVLHGNLVMSSTAGTLRYQWAQTTATVENTKTAAGSHLILTRLA